MSRFNLIAILSIAAIMPATMVYFQQFPKQKTKLEKMRQSVLKQVAEYLPKCESRRRG